MDNGITFSVFLRRGLIKKKKMRTSHTLAIFCAVSGLTIIFIDHDIHLPKIARANYFICSFIAYIAVYNRRVQWNYFNPSS